MVNVERAERIAREHMNRMLSPDVRRIEEEFKVPCSDSLWPEFYWIACIVAGNLHEAVMPSDVEVAQVASYIDYVLSMYYTESFARQVRALPLPLCGGHNTVVLVKRHDGWGYRRASWETGSWPHAYRPYRADAAWPEGLPREPLTLVQVLDKVCGWTDRPNPKWEAWKVAHPAVFPAEVTV